MGDKNPLVILDDADLVTAVECTVNGAFFSTGQRCTASSRLIVTEDIHDRFVEALLERMKGLTIGDGLDPATVTGAVVSQEQKEQILEYVRIGESEGALQLLGGAPPAGHYVAPTQFVDTHPSMRINHEEIFGPVPSVIKVKDLEHALNVANAVELGLSAGICTRSLEAACDFKRRATAHASKGFTRGSV